MTDSRGKVASVFSTKNSQVNFLVALKFAVNLIVVAFFIIHRQYLHDDLCSRSLLKHSKLLVFF